MRESAEQLANGRHETDLERLDRNLVELLQEVRVAQTGVQVLFGFLLAAVFQARFHNLSSFQRADYFGTLLATGLSVIMLTAPTSHHRILFRRGDKRHLVEVANRFTMIGLAWMALAMSGAVMLVSDMMFPPVVTGLVTASGLVAGTTMWYLLPLGRLRRLRRLDTVSAAARSLRVDGQHSSSSGGGSQVTQPPGAV